jgi:hypothetical protein
MSAQRIPVRPAYYPWNKGVGERSVPEKKEDAPKQR